MMMIEYGIFSLWKKIRFYRNVIIASFAMSILTVVSGVIAAFLLFNGAFDLSADIAAIGSYDNLSPEKWATLVEASKREAQLTYGLIFVAVSTLLFGVVVPALILKKAIDALRDVEKKLRTTLREVAESFANTLNQYGEAPFTNARYWAEVIMIALQFIGRDSKHPGLLLLADLIDLTRAEMNRHPKAPPQPPTAA